MACAVTFAVLSIVAVTSPAFAEDPSGATFLSDAPVEEEVVVDGTLTVDLRVINGSTVPVRMRMFLLDLRAPDGATELPTKTEPLVIGRIETTGPDRIDAGKIWTVSYELGPLLEGSYSGTFVVRANDGTVDRKPFTITVGPGPTAEPTPFASAASAGLVEPFPAITLAVTRSSWWGDDGDMSPPVSFPIPTALAPRLVMGELVNEAGERATVTLDSSGSYVITAGGPGKYKGVVGRPAEGEETEPKKLADITLTVRDDAVLAFFWLLAGLGIAFLIEKIATDWLPRVSFERRLNNVRLLAASAAAMHQAWIDGQKDWPGAGPRAPKIEGPDIANEIPYLESAVHSAKRDYGAAGSLEARTERWGSKGTELQKLYDNEIKYEELLGFRERLVRAWNGFLGRLVQADAENPTKTLVALASDSVGKIVGGVLTDGAIPSAAELIRRKAAAEELASTVGSMGEVAASLALIEHWILPGSAQRGKLTDLWEKLASVVDPKGDLEAVRKEARTVMDAVIDERAKRPAARANLELQGILPIDLGFTDAGVVELSNALIPSERAVPPADQARDIVLVEAQAVRAQSAMTVIYTLLVTIVALTTGMATQYYGVDAFGTPNHYLSVFTWAFAGATAASLIKNLTGILAVLGRR
jgi:hypothetical protein